MVDQRPLTVDEMFRQLGEAKITSPIGLAFAITTAGLENEYGGSEAKMMKAIPRPDYEHRILQDDVTGNYFVLRPGVDGTYFPEWSKMRRLR